MTPISPGLPASLLLTDMLPGMYQPPSSLSMQTDSRCHA